MTKTMILPIVAIIAMGVKIIFDVTISEDLQQQIAMYIATGILIFGSIKGVIKNHKKEVK